MLLAIKGLATLTQETSLDIQKGVASLQTSFLSKSTGIININIPE
jgi:hypothetical protein